MTGPVPIRGLSITVAIGIMIAVISVGGLPSAFGLVHDSESATAGLAASDNLSVTVENASVAPPAVVTNDTENVTVSFPIQLPNAVNGSSVTVSLASEEADRRVTPARVGCDDRCSVVVSGQDLTRLANGSGEYQLVVRGWWDYGRQFVAVVPITIENRPRSTDSGNGTATPAPNGTATSTPNGTVTPTPTPNETTAPTPTPNETTTPTSTPNETTTPTPTPNETATPTPTPNETATPTPTPNETVTPTPTPNETQTANETETPTETESPPTATETQPTNETETPTKTESTPTANETRTSTPTTNETSTETESMPAPTTPAPDTTDEQPMWAAGVGESWRDH